MRLYVANWLILSIVSLTTIVGVTRRFFSISNTFENAFYVIYVFLIAQNSLVLFSGSIEICLVVERILYLLPRRYSRIKFVGFKKFFFILLTVCILANTSGIVLFQPTFFDIRLDATNPFRIWYIVASAFSSSQAGRVLIYLGYLIRDVLPVVFNIVFNSFSIYLVRRYVQNKQRITALTTGVNTHLENFDRKQTYIALVMSTFSLLEHILYIISYVLYFFSYYELTNFTYIVALLFIAIKHILTFFILLALNSLFRNEVKIFFKLAPRG